MLLIFCVSVFRTCDMECVFIMCAGICAPSGHIFHCLVSSSLSPSLSLCWGGGGREVTIATMPGQINIKAFKKNL